MKEVPSSPTPSSGRSAPKVKGHIAAKSIERFMQILFLICGLIAVAFVLVISIYLIISGLPAIREVGLFNFLFHVFGGINDAAVHGRNAVFVKEFFCLVFQ